MKQLFSQRTVFQRSALVLLSLVITACAATSKEAANNKWQVLKPLKEYQPKDFKLAKDIEYLEIRQYTRSSSRAGRKMEIHPFSHKEYSKTFSAYKQPFASFDEKTKKAFNAQMPVLDQTTDIKPINRDGFSFSVSQRSNVFVIKKDGSVAVSNKTSSIFPMLGKIDTPAEMQLAIWLHNKHEGKQFKEVRNGYEAIIEYDNSVSNYEECGWFKYKAHIGKDGKLISYKLLKEKPSKNGCMVYD